jgi:hypothetical protein
MLLILPSVSAKGTPAEKWDRNTWAPFEDLARNHPEAGVHFQECRILNREKDVASATGAWFKELLSPNPWFSTLFKDVGPLLGDVLLLKLTWYSLKRFPSRNSKQASTMVHDSPRFVSTPPFIYRGWCRNVWEAALS